VISFPSGSINKKLNVLITYSKLTQICNLQGPIYHLQIQLITYNYSNTQELNIYRQEIDLA
jgi:hypothetical protein